MSLDFPGAARAGEPQCRYDDCRLMFRGPAVQLDEAARAFLGTSETYGRFVDAPFPRIIEQRLGGLSANLGCVNAGIDSFLSETKLFQKLDPSCQVVVQLMGAQNLSNPYYRVHPRRNDRFLNATSTLREVYPELDFTEFSFNRHLLTCLWKIDADRFRVIMQNLRALWIARMRQLIDMLDRELILLWPRMEPVAHSWMGKPGLVDADMIADLGNIGLKLVEVAVEPAGDAADMVGMSFAPTEERAAAMSLGPEAHGRIAEALLPYLK